MDIHQFRIGQTAYIVNLHAGRNKDPEIKETVVTAIGRRYATAKTGKKYVSEEWVPFGLIEEGGTAYGERTYLYFSRTEAETHIERDMLQRWIAGLSYNDIKKLTLEQLRRIKAWLS